MLTALALWAAADRYPNENEGVCGPPELNFDGVDGSMGGSSASPFGSMPWGVITSIYLLQVAMGAFLSRSATAFASLSQ